MDRLLWGPALRLALGEAQSPARAGLQNLAWGKRQRAPEVRAGSSIGWDNRGSHSSNVRAVA